MKLSDLLEVIVRWMIDDHFAYERLRGWRISFSDWPNGIPKQAAERYESLRSSKGPEYAAIVVDNEFSHLLNTNLTRPNLETIQALYIESVNQATALELAKALIRYPDRGAEIVKQFQFLSQAGQPVHFGTSIEGAALNMIEKFDRGESAVLLPGWLRLSDSIGGFNPGRVGLLVAKTGFGKTNLAASLAIDASEKFSTLFVNMEMLTEDFTEKLIMAAGGITYREIKKDPRSIANKLSEIEETHINRRLFFTDGQSLAVEDLAELARTYKQNHDLSIMIVDYDQKLKLSTTKDMPEWKALQIAVETLEMIAKKHKIYCLLLAQEGESQSGERGRVSGSRRSTFPASTVLNFYKDEEDDGNRYVIEATKNRFGPRGAKIEVIYSPETSRVKEKGYIEEAKLNGENTLRKFRNRREGMQRPSWNPSSD